MNEQLRTIVAELRERYAPPTVPPCRICGGALSLQQTGGGAPDVWACTGLVEGEYAYGRRIADQHYEASTWVDYKAGGDQRVIVLCDALESAGRQAEVAVSADYAGAQDPPTMTAEDGK